MSANIGLGFGYKFTKLNMALLAMFFVIIFTLDFKNKIGRLFGLAGLILICFGLLATHQEPAAYGQYFGQKKTKLTVVVVNDPEVKDKSHSFLGKVQNVNGQAREDMIVVVLPKYPLYEYGTRFVLEGELEPVSEFNLKDNVSAQIVFPKILEANNGSGNWLKKKIYDLKHVLLSDINQLLSSPESGLLGGLLLGTRHMPDYLIEQFRVTGTSHIIAVSGFNVTIVASFLDRMLRRFGRSVSFYSSILAISGFVIITGASASVVRAGIMGSLVLIAQHSGRLYASINALLLTSAVMLLQNPKLLVYDIGFQLSFAALAGLLFIQPLFDDKFPKANIVSSSIFPTIAAQVTTAPIILYHFGNFSLISVLANLLVLPSIPIAMFLGAAALAIYMIAPAAGAISAFLVWLLLKYVILVIGICSNVPLASLDNITFPLYALCIYFAVLSLFLIWKQKQKASLNI
ncbi:MAG: ComEC/Rec2 family competence protein [Candidatus Doudnabacteria bacterium]|nr:ComEC/Rec2 family competence protein [Candidatus Doudnabacteria bacterium]